MDEEKEGWMEKERSAGERMDEEKEGRMENQMDR